MTATPLTLSNLGYFDLTRNNWANLKFEASVQTISLRETVVKTGRVALTLVCLVLAPLFDLLFVPVIFIRNLCSRGIAPVPVPAIPVQGAPWDSSSIASSCSNIFESFDDRASEKDNVSVASFDSLQDRDVNVIENQSKPILTQEPLKPKLLSIDEITPEQIKKLLSPIGVRYFSASSQDFFIDALHAAEPSAVKKNLLRNYGLFDEEEHLNTKEDQDERDLEIFQWIGSCCIAYFLVCVTKKISDEIPLFLKSAENEISRLCYPWVWLTDKEQAAIIDSIYSGADKYAHTDSTRKIIMHIRALYHRHIARDKKFHATYAAVFPLEKD